MSTLNKEKVNGKIKQATGSITGNKQQKQEGKLEETLGQAKEKVNQTIDKISEKIKK